MDSSAAPTYVLGFPAATFTVAATFAALWSTASTVTCA
jgi:hypothetical protein